MKDVAHKTGVHLHELDPKAVALTMLGVLIAIFMGSLDQTIVATALPAITKSLHGFGGYSGVITAYLIASTAILPIGGKLCDVYGRKKFLIGGILWFVVASALCGFARTITQLILFRALKGIGTGITQAAANTTIADLYPPARRGTAIGLVSTTSVLANVIGPLLGGFLTDGPGWRYIFFINLPVGLIGAVVVFYYFPRIKRPLIKDFKIDYWGVLTMLASVIPILLALQNVGEKNEWSSMGVLGLLGMGCIFTAIFIQVERKASHPIVPFQVFKNPIISISLLATGLTMATMFAVTLFVPLFLQSVLGSSAKTSGEVLLPLSITFSVTATLTGHLVGRINRYRTLAIIGAAICVIGAYLLAHMSAETSHLALLRNTVIIGFGLAVCMSIYNTAVQNAAHLGALGVATSMVYFVRSMAASVGVAVFGTILTWQTPSSGLVHALSSIYWLVTGLCIVTFIITLFLKEIPLRKSNISI